MTTLSNRLSAIAKLLPPCPLAADIGADHGHLSVYLIESGLAEHVLCTDLSEPSLQKARDAVKQKNLEHAVSFYVGDGLTPIRDKKPDAVIIAGMGGETIADILSGETPCEGTVFLLQPMSRAAHLRRFLAEHAFLLEDEVLAQDKTRIYPILRAVKTKNPIPSDDLDCLVGRAHFSRDDELTRIYLQRIYRSLTRRRAGRQSASLSTAREDALIARLQSKLSPEVL